MIGAGGVRRRSLARAALLALAALLTTASAAMARENYALIVAASEYPNLPEQFWLKGPKNDAGLVRDYLLHDAPVKFEPQNVVTLGSGDGLELATHQRILDSPGGDRGEGAAGRFRVPAVFGARLAAAGGQRSERAGRQGRDVPQRRHGNGAAGQPRPISRTR